MFFATNVRHLRKQHGYTQEYVAEKLGYKSFTTVQKWESGESKPHYDKMIKLAELFDVDINDLTGMDLSSSSFKAPYISGSSQVPIIGSVPVDALPETFEHIRGYVDMPSHFLREKKYFAMEINDESMMPDFRTGDIVIFESAAECKSSDMCVVRLGGEDIVFRKIRKKRDCFLLQPLNPEYEPVLVDISAGSGDPSAAIEVLGIAREIRRSI